MYIKRILKATLLITQVGNYHLPYFRSVSELFAYSNYRRIVLSFSFMYLLIRCTFPLLILLDPVPTLFLPSEVLNVCHVSPVHTYNASPQISSLNSRLHISTCQPDLLLIYTHTCVQQMIASTVIGNENKSGVGDRGLEPCLHSHCCRRLGVEWLFHVLWSPWALMMP